MNGLDGVPNPAEMAAGERRRAVQRCWAEVLIAARCGDLEADWREARPAAAFAAVQEWRPGPPLLPPCEPLNFDDFDPANPLAPLGEMCDWWMGAPARENALLIKYFTILDVASVCPVGAWEPGSGAPAHEALDAWYQTSVACAATELAELPEIPYGSDERSQRIALSMGPTVMRWRAENQQRVDLLTEWFEAGLVSIGGGDGDWVARSRERVSKWSEVLGFSRNAQLWKLDDPLYQASRELLPPYWSTSS